MQTKFSFKSYMPASGAILVVLLMIVWVVAPSGLRVLQADEPAKVESTKSDKADKGADESAIPSDNDSARTRLAGGDIRPAIDQADLFFLLRYARRAMGDTLRGKQPTTQPYCPSVFRDFEGDVYVTAWRSGADLAQGHSKAENLAQAAVEAGVMLGEQLLKDDVRVRRGGADIGLELELTGQSELIDVQYFGDSGTWTSELQSSYEPGIEGFEVRFADRVGRILPTDVIEKNYSPDLALLATETQVGVKHEFKVRFADKVKYYRFWGFQVWQAGARAPMKLLYRGEELVPQDAVDGDRLDATIARVGGYLHYRQNSNGAFSHEYLPSRDTYHDANDVLVQLRALYGLQRYAARMLHPVLMADAKKGIEAFSKYLDELKFKIEKEDGEAEIVDSSDAMILTIPGHENHFETTAYLLLAMTSHPRGRLDDKMLVGMATTMVGAQLMDGSLRLKLGEAPSGETTASEDRAAGTALFGLAQHYAITKDAIIEQVFANAMPYYLGKTGKLDPESAAWIVRAFAKQHDSTENPQLLPIVFDLADRFVAVQLNKDNCPHPELHGAFNAKQLGVVGSDSAVYLGAVADALRAARRVDDQERVKRYEAAVRAGVRFVMQLEMTPTGSYFVRSKRDVLGGIRKRPWNVRMRVDDTALAVDGLLAARAALFNTVD